MAGRQLIVELVGDDSKFTGTLREATVKAEGFGGKLKNVGKGLAIGAGVAGFNLLTTAISTGISKLDEMHQAFLDDEASQLRLQNVLKNTVSNYDEASKAAEDFAGAQQRLGFEDDAVRDSLAQLVGQTHDLAEAQKLTNLAMDLARAKNIDLAQATDVITKAYNGQARGLAALGVDIQGAVGGTQLLARAMQNVNGAANAYAKTGAGRVAAANVKMQETMEKVGGVIDKVSQIVIPIMVDGLSEIVDITGDVIAAITGLANNLNSVLGPALSFIAQLAANVAGALGAVVGLVGGVVQGAQNLAGAVFGGGGGGGGTSQPGVIDVSKGGSFNIGVPIHHTGGIVAGAPGSDQLIMAQAGERIIPNSGAGAPTIVINIASFIGSDRDIDRFSDRLAFRLRAVGLG